MRAGNRDSGFGIRQGAPAPAARFPKARLSTDECLVIPIPESRQQGFSLLEVIAAILLLALAFTALMKVAGASISLSHHAAERSEAAMWARSLLDSAFVGEPIRPGSRSGQFNPRYRWQLDVTPWSQGAPALPGAPLQLYQLDLAVSWGPPVHPRSAHFRTLRLGGPAPAGNAQAAR